MTDDLRAAIERAGGLATLRDLARRWGVSAPRAHELAQHPAFPAPVALIGGGKTALYAIAEADAWRATRRYRGRPPSIDEQIDERRNDEAFAKRLRDRRDREQKLFDRLGE